MTILNKNLINWLKRAVLSIILISFLLNISVFKPESIQAQVSKPEFQEQEFVLPEIAKNKILALLNAGLNNLSELKEAETSDNEFRPNLLFTSDSVIGQNKAETFKRIKITVTAYSSTPDQTKPEDPFTMASGKIVYDGAVAANFLEFGTKIKIPGTFGEKIFTVEDRMNKRFKERIDIWFPTRFQAKQFGIQTLEIIVL